MSLDRLDYPNQSQFNFNWGISPGCQPRPTLLPSSAFPGVGSLHLGQAPPPGRDPPSVPARPAPSCPPVKPHLQHRPTPAPSPASIRALTPGAVHRAQAGRSIGLLLALPALWHLGQPGHRSSAAFRPRHHLGLPQPCGPRGHLRVRTDAQHLPLGQHQHGLRGFSVSDRTPPAPRPGARTRPLRPPDSSLT